MSEGLGMTSVVILDTSGIKDPADYGGMLWELKRVGICDGRDFQIDNSFDLLMNRETYDKCRDVLTRFGAKDII